jgi:hypothetical protein
MRTVLALYSEARAHGARHALGKAGRYADWKARDLATRATSPLVGALKRARRRTFRLNGRKYRYAFHSYNTTWRNERCVELAFARDYVARHPRVLEVGNVLGHYGVSGHDVVDRYEVGDGVVNVDVLDFRPETPYDLIVSISTLEHVGWDERPFEPSKAIEALRTMASWLSPGGTMVVTVPVGYNRFLDEHIFEERAFSELYALRRVTATRWHEVSLEKVRRARYGVPYPAATAVLLGVYRAPDEPDA